MTFECSVDGSLWTPCSSPFTAGPLTAGDPESGEQHEFEVRAVSRFVNIDGEPIVDQTPATYTWTVFPLPDPPAFDTVITQSPRRADRRRSGRDLHVQLRGHRPDAEPGAVRVLARR